MIVIFNVVVIGCILYSFTVIFACVIRVYQMIFKAKRDKALPIEEDRTRERLLMLSAVRLLGYPLVLIITMPAECILSIVYYTRTRETSFGNSATRAKAVLTGMQGVLNLIIFLFNPAFTSALSNFSIFKNTKYFRHWNQTVTYTAYIGDYTHTRPNAENKQTNGQNYSHVRENKILPNQHLLGSNSQLNSSLMPTSKS
ncbi:uncharacterized protein VTP21DRAFT_60 [Calcarisporiella thermophila]|uniref:uncharacterized protein n=1 Tax=Calcarisporiella thermophila TaxID=911321 RepID=UPI0037427172